MRLIKGYFIQYVSLIAVCVGIIMFLLLISCNQNVKQKESLETKNKLDISNKVNAFETLKVISNNYRQLLDFKMDSMRIPRSIENGKLDLIKSRNWCSGFYPGIWWMLYNYNNDDAFAKEAEEWTWLLEKEKLNGSTHDMGFKVYCSFGWGYRLTQRDDFKNVVIESAKTLSTRFNPKVKAIQSWDRPEGHKWAAYPVIIDNMMNLELLFAASKLTKDSIYYNIAVDHADTTLKHHFREDNSSYHVVDFDELTGEVITKDTHQGISKESSWARGQGWGLYGFTLMYRETKNKVYLDMAIKIADYIIRRLPDDDIPYWDFDDPKIPNAPRDTSAAALYASALLELQAYVPHKKKQIYLKAVQHILKQLGTETYTKKATLESPFILKHATGNLPANSEIDAPIIYADYYYVEALLRAKNLNTVNKALVH